MIALSALTLLVFVELTWSQSTRATALAEKDAAFKKPDTALLEKDAALNAAGATLVAALAGKKETMTFAIEDQDGTATLDEDTTLNTLVSSAEHLPRPSCKSPQIKRVTLH